MPNVKPNQIWEDTISKVRFTVETVSGDHAHVVDEDRSVYPRGRTLRIQEILDNSKRYALIVEI
jgi:hypothetical protein